jgi:hypothetical protein
MGTDGERRGLVSACGAARTRERQHQQDRRE